MLTHLTIDDIVLIERLEIDFPAGLTVLTGETGAGKSILLDSLALALGARGDASLVRQGARLGQVCAVFDLADGHPVHDLLRDNGMDAGDGLILRRVQSGDGKTRAFVNDQPCSAGLLRTLGAALVEIHGQHDDRALIDPDSHRRLLDAFGRLEADAEAVALCSAALKAARGEAAELSVRIEEAEREREFLQSAVNELETLGAVPGEEAELAELRQQLMGAEKISGDLNEAHELIGGGASPIPDLAGLLRRLERKSTETPGILDDTVAALSGALDRLEDARGALDAAIRIADFDPLVLEQTEERLFALRGAARKYQTLPDELPAVAAGFADRLAALDTGQSQLADLENAVTEAQDRYRRLALALSGKRQHAAGELVLAVNAELPALKLDAAEFLVDCSQNESTESPEGIDIIQFHVRTNPGTAAGPMLKVASGGELSRFLLALKVALADRGSAPTLVFDEIDSGVGGAVAAAIGRRLGRLAEAVQVLSVTHAPQVAARAGAHMLISKANGDDDAVVTGVAHLDDEGRREEIARMLAGETITDEARAAAGKLLALEGEGAGGDGAKPAGRRRGSGKTRHVA